MDIKGITNILGRFDREIRKAKNESPAPSKSADKVEISNTAQSAAKTASYVKMVKDAPDIRAEKVDEAKAKVESGFYLSREVAREVARKIVESLIP